MFPSYRNQSINLLCKSIDLVLCYDRNIERYNRNIDGQWVKLRSWPMFSCSTAQLVINVQS